MTFCVHFYILICSLDEQLWHGSRLTNYVGIISQGLRIAPPEAPVTGYMFGKGVYFADMYVVSLCISPFRPVQSRNVSRGDCGGMQVFQICKLLLYFTRI